MKYSSLIFDLDGTLLNTVKDLAKAANFALVKNGFKKRNIKEVTSYLGHGSSYTIKKCIGEEIEEEKFNKVFNDYFSYYLSHPTRYTKIYPKIRTLLKLAKKQNLKLFIVTNKPNDICLKVTNHFFKNDFDKIYPQRENHKRKPDKEVIDEVINDFNLKRENILYIGDSLVDYLTAINGNVDYLIVTYGYESKENLEKIPSENKIKNIKEIINLLK